MLELRDYQREAIDNVLRDWHSGIRRTLLMAATGTGKTIMFLGLIDDVLRREPAARFLVIAHRRELIHQPVERIETYLPHLTLKTGIVMADADDVGAQIIVATIQSLVAGNRLERILAHGPIDYVIIDEAHHAPAGTYKRVIEALGDPYVLGCTATPKRTDKLPLKEVFKTVSYRISIRDAIQAGALVPFTAMGFQLPVDASQVKETADGWEDEPMGDLLSAENILEIVLEKWREYAADRQAIGFTASVAQAHATAAHFSLHGVHAAAVDGTTPQHVRDQILGDYRSGRLQVVFNCMVLTEGFDAPETACVMMIAPTRSDLMYVQRLGRGLRTAADKSDCLVLDFAPKNARDLVFAGDILDGVPKQLRQAVEQAEEQDILFGFRVEDAAIMSVDPHDIHAVVLDYLTHSRLAWIFDGGFATAALSKDTMIAILPPEFERLDKADDLRRAGTWSPEYDALFEWIGRYRLYRIDKVQIDETHHHWQAKCLGGWASMTAAKRAAEEISKTESDDGLSGKSSGWRKRPMTEGQAKYLRILGAYEPGLTSDQAARRITFTLARRSVLAAEKTKTSRILRQGASS